MALGPAMPLVCGRLKRANQSTKPDDFYERTRKSRERR